MINNISIDNTSISFTDEGEGEIFLLLHGFPSCLFFWDDIKQDLLEKNFRVIVVEQRGYPLSKLFTDDTDNFNIEYLASDIEILINEIANNNPINILGHDWGSIVGWSIVMRSNIFVKSFISICGGDEFPQASVYSKLTYNNKPHYISSFQNPHLSASVLDKDLDLFFRSSYRETSNKIQNPELSMKTMFSGHNMSDLVLNSQNINELINHFSDSSLFEPISWYSNIDKNITLSDAWRKKVDTPSYFIYGEYDYAIQLTPKLNERILKLGTDINISIVPKAGHWLPITHKESVLEAIYSFVGK